MRKLLLYIPVILVLFSSCGHKNIVQGSVLYNIEYQLPDSLRSYADYLPKTAIVYFKGDSTISIQQAGAEATTVITYRPTNFMRVLLSSSAAKYQVDYKKSEQAEILPPAEYSYGRTNQSKTIAGHKAARYVLTEKWNGLISEVWFTKDIKMVPNYITAVYDTAYGVPFAIVSNQNNIVTKTTVKQIKFEPVPDGIFSTPGGYQKMTPKQFKELPVEDK